MSTGLIPSKNPTIQLIKCSVFYELLSFRQKSHHSQKRTKKTLIALFFFHQLQTPHIAVCFFEKSIKRMRNSPKIYSLQLEFIRLFGQNKKYKQMTQNT